ncbi:GcrA family cell cycle regulator [Methylocapsa sp. D3K7]|uniref:GcrA family cell cycle regulator n=1 Tax=Methylocapsa sp. D3K7 TaxID=3041435 RepID=UPI00244E7960|nr:GcrA family cell cycle regulator [Methylocapsa sp. D3K7]WGJ15767.1 GcrA family cell cycle regulator [Methylocapsa sp. D3K7]
MLAFEELSHDACRWPIADCGIGGEKGQFLFCGDAIAERYIAPGVPCPYCTTHAGMAYEPSRPAKRTIAKSEAAEERRLELILIAAAA